MSVITDPTPTTSQSAPSHDILFEPTTVGSLHVKNRYTMGPMGPLGFADADGGWNQRGIEYYAARARGGFGMIITGVCQVANPAEDVPTGMIPNPNQKPAVFLRTSRELCERVHAYDTKLVLQVGAGFGRVIMPSLIKPGSKPAAPSPIPYLSDPSISCREITREEIATIVANFRQTAGVAKRAGFDGIQVHAVHEGYLLDQFAIEFFNRRTDEYGGSLENRLRFAREIVEAIHDVAGDDFPVQLRFSPKSMIKDWNSGAMPGEEFTEAGRDLDEGIEAAKLLHSYGYETLDIDVGSYDAWYWSHPPMYQEPGLYLPYAAALKEAAPEIPLIVAGRMDNPDLAAKAVASGQVDSVSLARPSLADPEIVNKIQRGDVASIRPCISCQEGCIGRIGAYTALNCAVNAQAGRESDFVLLPVPRRRAKKVWIIGGGLAGMEAARVLAERGHEPIVFEATDSLGGVVKAGGAPSFKHDDLALIRWFEHELRALGVEIRLNTEVTAEMIRHSDADQVLVTTGSRPRELPLGDDLPALEAMEALLDHTRAGKRVAVIGGGLTGCELALHLVENGHEVSIVEVEPKLLAKNGPLCHANHDMLEELVSYRGVDVHLNARTTGTSSDGLVVVDNGKETVIPADTVVTAIGYQAQRDLWEALEGSKIPRQVIGDARNVSNIMYAIWDAYEVASKL